MYIHPNPLYNRDLLSRVQNTRHVRLSMLSKIETLGLFRIRNQQRAVRKVKITRYRASSILFVCGDGRSSVLSVSSVFSSRKSCAAQTRRRNGKDGTWNIVVKSRDGTHDTRVATVHDRVLCIGIRHDANERDHLRVECVPECRQASVDSKENGWKSRSDLRQLLVRKIQYVTC